MEKEYQQKYIIEDAPGYSQSNIWHKECAYQQIPFIRVDKKTKDFSLMWDFFYLPMEILNNIYEQTPSLAQSIKNLVEAEVGTVKGWAGLYTGYVVGLTREQAIGVAEELGEYLFNQVELAQQERHSDAG